ncbi:hypothetical protein Taro_015183, partial [Colocasia esculenta]|nr:hypothetical protein [Colocasia esculenta]
YNCNQTTTEPRAHPEVNNRKVKITLLVVLTLHWTTDAKSPDLPHLVGAGRTTQHKSEGVQEDDKTSSVPSAGTSPEHSRA